MNMIQRRTSMLFRTLCTQRYPALVDRKHNKNMKINLPLGSGLGLSLVAVLGLLMAVLGTVVLVLVLVLMLMLLLVAVWVLVWVPLMVLLLLMMIMMLLFPPSLIPFPVSIKGGSESANTPEKKNKEVINSECIF